VAIVGDLRADWRANRDPLARLVLTVYRFGRWAQRWPRVLREIPLTVYRLVNLMLVRLVAGVDLPRRAVAGPGLRLEHGGRGLAVHPAVVLGAGVTLFHGVTIGQKRAGKVADAPTVGDNVRIWPYAVLAGGIVVGDGAEIGAHALVLDDVPPGGRAFAPRAVVVPAKSGLLGLASEA